MKTHNPLITNFQACLAAASRWLKLLPLVAFVAIAGCESPEERVANYVASAEQYFEEEDLVKAELEAKNALQIEPKNADARYVLARIAGAKREFNDMALNLRIAIETKPDFVEAIARLGTLYSQVGAAELAEEQLAELEKFAPESVETYMLRARVLAAKGDYEPALGALKAAINKEPDNIIAMGLMASLISTSDVDEALVIVEDAIKKSPDSRELRMLKIDMLTKAARSDAVEAAYRDLIDKFPEEFSYRFMLARFLADEGNIDEVDDVLMEAIELDPTNQEAKLTLVRFVAGTQGTEEGVALLRDFIDQDPEATELRVLLADQLLDDGDTENAKAEFQKIAETEGNNDAGLKARTRIAGINIADGEIEAGSAIVKEVLALDPLNANANYLSGLINYTNADWKSAVSDLRSALRQDPTNVRAQWLLARTHLKAGDLLLAEEAYRVLLEDSPINVAASLELAGLLIDIEETKKAEELLSRQAALMPNEIGLSRALIGVLVEREKYAEALAEAERFGATEGNEAVGNFFLGGVYLAQKQVDKAEEAFRAAVQQRPEAREPLQKLVSILAAQDRLDEARDYLEELAQKFPENLFIKTLLGQILAFAGDEDAARDIFETALDDQSDWLPAYAALASLESDNPEAQINVYRRGLQASPGNQQMVLLLGTAYERRGEIDKAIIAYEEALRDNPNLPLVANNLAALLSDYRQDTASFNRALEVAQQLEASEQPLLLDTLGWVYYRLGDYAQAQRLLERAVEGAPNVAVLRYHLGMIYLAQDKQQLSIEQLRAATEVPEIQYPGRDEAEEALAQLLGTN